LRSHQCTYHTLLESSGDLASHGASCRYPALPEQDFCLINIRTLISALTIILLNAQSDVAKQLLALRRINALKLTIALTTPVSGPPHAPHRMASPGSIAYLTMATSKYFRGHLLKHALVLFYLETHRR
jgi:hypothetical protein